jgi:glycosyltransferase involved in cell wall biosynthesis
MKNYPKISIVTPSYNQGQYIEDTILSVLGQFYPNLEYLIYDAASTDNSVEIIKKYENQLTYWVSDKDNGQADAVNKGFNRCAGDILMWLNSDDMLMPNVLHFIAEQFVEHGDGIYFGNCIHFEEKSSGTVSASGSQVGKKFNNISLELVDTIIQPSSFWSRKVWLQNGELNAKFHFGFDWEWFLRAKKNDISFYDLSKPISLYRFHEAHKTGVGGGKRQEELFDIYSMYNNNYADLYNLIRNENFKFKFYQKILIKLSKTLFKNKYRNTYFLKQFKKEYKGYTIEEINNIKQML